MATPSSISALFQDFGDCPDTLQRAHGDLEQRLELLLSRRSLSPEEQFEVQVLKKRKLAIKDQLLHAQAPRRD